MLFEKPNYALGFAKSPDKRDHDLDVRQTHGIAYEAQRLTLHGETLGKVGRQVTCGPTVSDHRIFFMWLIQLTADQAGVLIRFEVRHPYDHRVRCECGRNSRNALGQPTYEEIPRCLVRRNGITDLAP